MKLRTIPYGYAMVFGKVVIHPQECTIVRRVFREHQAGASLRQIANALTTEGAEFLPGVSNWSPCRIKRMLEDTRYGGSKIYPALLEEEMRRQMFHREKLSAPMRHDADRLGGASAPSSLPCPMVCGVCGSTMTRFHDRRRKIPEFWRCTNAECGAVVDIADTELWRRVTALLQRLRDCPELVAIPQVARPEFSLEVRRHEQMIQRVMETLDFDRKQLQDDVFRLAAKQFRQLDETPVLSRMLREELWQGGVTDLFPVNEVKRIVSAIQWEQDQLALILRNHQVFGEE